MKRKKTARFFLFIALIAIIALACALLVWDLRPAIAAAIKARDWQPLTDKFASYGFWTFFFIGLANAIQVALAVLPGQPLHIIAGITLGPILGTLACLAGVFLANIIILMIVRKTKTAPLLVYREKDEAKLEKVATASSDKARVIILLALYLIPIMPFGLIAFAAAKSKLKFGPYIATTTVGAAPAILLSTWFGSLIIDSNYVLVSIVLFIVIILVILGLKYYPKIINYLETKLAKDMRYFQNNVRPPRRWLYRLVYLVVRLYYFPKFRVRTNSKDFKKYPAPYVLIYNHPSFFDWAFAFAPLYPRRVNAIMNYYYFCNYRLGTLLNKIGAFPKYLFQPDISAVKNIKRVIKNGGIVGIAPEGRLSPHGRMESITAATAKLLKNLGVPVLLAKINGAYFSYPKWAKTYRRGRVDVNYRELFDAERIKNLQVEEIEEILQRELAYDDYKWQEETGVVFKGKRFAEGLEDILYICPACKREFTLTAKDDALECSRCGLRVRLGGDYRFTSDAKAPENIAEWFEWQKERERERIEAGDYRLEAKVTLKLPDPEGKGMKVAGSGTTVLDREGLTYRGTVYGETKEIVFKIQNLPAIPFGARVDFEVCHHNTLYYFIPEDIRACVKWSVVGEQFYYQYLKENGNEQRPNNQDQ
jgi:1-acyl-sn-glycerol-3-phosphate acyltransferase